MSHPQIAERAADAIHTLGWLRSACMDQPRIIAECGGLADLSSRADDVAKLAAQFREITEELERVAAALAGAGVSELRRAA
nr:hypothetical protein NG677_04480 [Methylobacterium sp. OTU13CASTA1]